jgi:hypothetical protein
MKNKLPSPSQEITEAAMKGVVSMIPVVGGLLAELGGRLVNPMDKRRRLWFEEMELGLEELAEKFDRLPEALGNDPEFVTALLRATAAALATHKVEKLHALRKFVVAVGGRAIPDEELQSALLRLLDDITVGHIEVLQFLEKNLGEIRRMEDLESVFGSYRYRNGGRLDRTAFRRILSDLTSRMVIHSGDLEDLNEYKSLRAGIVAENSKILPLQITELGRELLSLLR